MSDELSRPTASAFIGSYPGGAAPGGLYSVGDHVLISAVSTIFPYPPFHRLWSTDGTEAGTRMLATMPPVAPYSPTVAGTTLFAVAADSNELWTDANDLWATDGTDEGTWQVLSPSGDSFRSVSDLVAIENELFFVADAGPVTRAIWRTDGTVAGTQLISTATFADNWPEVITRVGNAIYYVVAPDGTGTRELWRTDVTDSITERVIEIPTRFVRILAANDNAFLIFEDGQIWITDGTEAGTTIAPGDFSQIDLDSDVAGVVGERLLLIIGDENGTFLASTDGHTAPTPILSAPNYRGWLHQFQAIGDQLFFWQESNRTDVEGCDMELWRTDGTAENTHLVVTQTVASFEGCYQRVIGTWAIDGEFYFVSATDFELWRSDGTANGTERVTGNNPEGKVPYSLLGGGNRVLLNGDSLYFVADDGFHGAELYRLKLEDAPFPNDDRNHDGRIDVLDLDDICAALAAGTASRGDVDGFRERQRINAGDANFDHRFESSDLVAVFQRALYESGSPAVWSEGDWNCDGVFDSSDLVVAFQAGTYVAAANRTDLAAAVDVIFEQNDTNGSRAISASTPTGVNATASKVPDPSVMPLRRLANVDDVHSPI